MMLPPAIGVLLQQSFEVLKEPEIVSCAFSSPLHTRMISVGRLVGSLLTV
jgi:hypothetical protein